MKKIKNRERNILKRFLKTITPYFELLELTEI